MTSSDDSPKPFDSKDFESPDAIVETPSDASPVDADAVSLDEVLGSDSQDPPSGGESPQPARPTRRRRVRLPLVLFGLTCFSTFWVGATNWAPTIAFAQFTGGRSIAARQTLLAHWQDGLIYMACVLAILLTHEMGHFLATVRYRIPASFPFFIPFPVSPIGTMGAVIGMDGLRADRKEIFDIGLAGPVAGLVIALPIMWVGINKLDMTQPGYGPYAVDLPLSMRMAIDYLEPPGYAAGDPVWYSQLNPYFMAGWVGLLITGLNMLPVSQLDGGHVVYTLFGKRSYLIARAFLSISLVYMVYTFRWQWIVMWALVLLIGPNHPPTRDDSVRLGWFRIVLGLLSMLIPIFCFAPRLMLVAQ